MQHLVFPNGNHSHWRIPLNQDEPRKQYHFYLERTTVSSGRSSCLRGYGARLQTGRLCYLISHRPAHGEIEKTLDVHTKHLNSKDSLVDKLMPTGVEPNV